MTAEAADFGKSEPLSYQIWNMKTRTLDYMLQMVL